MLGVCDADKLRLEQSKTAIELGWKQLDKNLASSNKKSQHFKKALLHFQHGLLLDIKSGPAWFACAYAYSLTGDVDESLKFYRKSLVYQPNYTSTHMNIGVILLSKGDMKNAFKSLQKASELEPERGMVHGNLARWYLVNKQLSKAKEELALAYKYQKPEDTAFLNVIAKYINSAKSQ